MRKIVMSLFILAGVLLGGALPASATAAAGLSVKPAITSEALVEKAGWGHHRHHGGLFFGFGGFGGGYPYYGRSYYNNYSYYQPRSYGYSYYAPRRHHRHWCDRHDRWEY